jgi:formyltetrahydrofolate deformylase
VDPQAVLLVSCPDQAGIVAAISAFVHTHGGNILDLQQHTDRSLGVFFQRVQFELTGFDLPREAILAAMEPLLDRFAMNAEVRFTDQVPRTAIFVSSEPHCLHELLSRWRAGELLIDLRSVISNHPDHADVVGWFGVPYHHVPVSRDTKAVQEGQIAEFLRAEGVELIVLARYMQILSPEFAAPWEGRAINIHHSFLPAFQGARPYHQAHDRGVKLIGVTAHYVTAALDEGPIIDQDVVRISHRDDPDALRRKGRDLEVTVLARAVRAHLEHRVLIHGRRTIVFDD